MVGSRAKFTEGLYKAPEEGGDPRGLVLEFLSLEVFMRLLVGCFNLINPPCPSGPIRFLTTGSLPIRYLFTWERPEGSFRGIQNNRIGSLFFLRVVSSQDRSPLASPAFLLTILVRCDTQNVC